MVAPCLRLHLLNRATPAKATDMINNIKKPSPNFPESVILNPLFTVSHWVWQSVGPSTHFAYNVSGWNKHIAEGHGHKPGWGTTSLCDIIHTMFLRHLTVFPHSAANIPLLNCTSDANPSTGAKQAWAHELSYGWCTERLKGGNLSRLSALCPNTDV